MPKTSKISVLRGKMTVEIPVNPGSVESLKDAAGKLTSVYEHAVDLGAQVAMPEPHVVRVPAPATTGDGLDIPEPLRRTGNPKPVAAE